MLSADLKLLLQKHVTDLFDLHNALESLKFNPAYQPILRYNRGLQSDFELYFGTPETPPAPLEIVWATPYGTIPMQAPKEVQQRASALLRELENQRELVALYRCGYIEGDKFVLSSWLIPFPVGYKKTDSDGSGVYYTVTRARVLGLARPYTDNRTLGAALI